MGTVHTFPHDDNPTPTTRFIRNCDAVGLFNDLSPNPFEETFRMATATDLSLMLKDPPAKTNMEETLNTPRVISSTTNQPFQSCPGMDDDEDVIVLNDFLDPILPETHHIPSSQNDINSNDSSDVEIIENQPQTNSTVTKSIPVCNSNSSISFENIIFTINDNAAKNGSVEGFLLEPTSSQPSADSLTVNLNTNKEFILQKPVVSNVKESAVKKSTPSASCNPSFAAKSINTLKNPNIVYMSGTNLPAILSGKNVVILPSRNSSKCVETKFSKIASRPLIDNENQNIETSVKQKLRNLLQNNNSSPLIDLPVREEYSETRDSNSVSSVEDDKRECSRERNRMAQKRCRLKKKRYFMQLKNETESALNDNRKLGSLVHSLQAEIAHLKTLLLAHRNCSVTRAMYKADLNTIMNNEVSEIVEDIEIPACDDADDHSSPRQITYRHQYKQVHNQQVNQVNHIHVHVPASPEASGDQFLNFAPDANLFAAQPFTFPRQMNVVGSKFSANKRLICDSKMVPIRANDRTKTKKTVVSDASCTSTSSRQPTTGNRRPELKIFISENKSSSTKSAGAISAAVSTVASDFLSSASPDESILNVKSIVSSTTFS